jgi:hypothetical protein
VAHIELVRRKAYFFCGYCAEHDPVPSIETYIYLGLATEVLGGSLREKVEHIFQDADLFYQEQRGELSPTSSATDRGLVLIADNLLDPMVQDYDGLISFIERCKRDASK